MTYRPDYGLDAPHVARNWLLTGSVSFFLWFALRQVSAPRLWRTLAGATAGLSLAAAPFHVYSSRVLKLREAAALLDAMSWRGDERVLDVGCGRGLLLVKAARRLTGGIAVGVDTWQAKHHAGNHGDATLANAAAEGVRERVVLCDGDARRLPFRDSSFDTVLSNLCVHNISHLSSSRRRRALEEMFRVLKPNGQIAIMDIVWTAMYAHELRELGMLDVRHTWRLPLWSLPFGWVMARKPPR